MFSFCWSSYSLQPLSLVKMRRSNRVGNLNNVYYVQNWVYSAGDRIGNWVLKGPAMDLLLVHQIEKEHVYINYLSKGNQCCSPISRRNVVYTTITLAACYDSCLFVSSKFCYSLQRSRLQCRRKTSDKRIPWRFLPWYCRVTHIQH